jgi:hypothetical protein
MTKLINEKINIIRKEVKMMAGITYNCFYVKYFFLKNGLPNRK